VHHIPSMSWALFFSAMLGLGLLALTAVLAIEGWRGLRVNWRSGIVLGLALFVLVLPAQLFVLAHLDVQALMDRLRLPPEETQVATLALYFIAILAFTISVIKIPWYMLVYHAAVSQWERFGPDPFPLLQRSRPAPWAAIGRAAAFGVAAGVLSVVVFRLIGVGQSDILKQYDSLAPSGGKAMLLARLPMAALFGTAAALGEELTYRGVLYGWLLRLVGREGRSGVALAAVATSLLWAVAHAPNTDLPLVKCAQIFVLGLFFCEFARRWCLEAAMAAHVGVNLAALLVGAALG
jgi:membrane protease YdiL (CAAX protease family)